MLCLRPVRPLVLVFPFPLLTVPLLSEMNAESSRSHSIFVITVQARNTETGTQKTGSLFLVDLAGSEKIGKTGATGQTLEEAKKINKSLSALGMVINALTDGKVRCSPVSPYSPHKLTKFPPQSAHIPYRDSKLTRILQESLGGNSRTTLIINCSPSPYNETETLSTLRFGMRAKSIKNKARVNAELSPAELKALLKKAQRDYTNAGTYIGLLEQEVSVWRSGGTVDQEKWASMEKALGLKEGELEQLVGGAGGGKPKLKTPALDRVSDGGISRPETPTGSPMDSDEREEFVRRQNEMEDQLAKAVRFLSSSFFLRTRTHSRTEHRNRKSRRPTRSSATFGKSSTPSKNRRRLPCPRTSR